MQRFRCRHLVFSFQRLYSILRSVLMVLKISSVGLFTFCINAILSTLFSDCDVIRLNTLGYRIGTRYLELLSWRTESLSKAPKREIRFLPAIMMIHTQLWRALFGKPADAIERSVENNDECKKIITLILLPKTLIPAAAL